MDELDQRVRALNAERARLTPKRLPTPAERLEERAARLLTRLQAEYGPLHGYDYPQPDPGYPQDVPLPIHSPQGPQCEAPQEAEGQ